MIFYSSLNYCEIQGLTYREAIELYDFYSDAEIENSHQLLDAVRVYIAESVTVALSETIPAFLNNKKTGALKRFVEDVKRKVAGRNPDDSIEIPNEARPELVNRFDNF